MAFVDELPTRRIDVPDEDGQWFEVRLLSWKELQACRREAQRKYMQNMNEVGPQFIKMMAELEKEAPQAVESARAANEADDTSEYDPEELVRRSVCGWSYPRHFQPALLDKLTEATFTWLYGEIVKLYRGDDAQRKDVSATSSTT